MFFFHTGKYKTKQIHYYTLLIFITVTATVLLSENAAAQEKVIKIWENKIPGEITDSTVKEDTIIMRGSRRIRKITDPDILVYLPSENPSGTAVLVIPGGGYERVAIDPEGIEVAKWLNSLGIAAFVLKYRLPDDRTMQNKAIGPLQDAQEAMRIIRRKAEDFNLSRDKIGVIGFSAGGHLASTLAVHYDDKIYESDTSSARPDFTILVYPVISMFRDVTHGGTNNLLLGSDPSEELINYFSNELHVNGKTPPAFLVHSFDDNTVPVQNSIRYFLALKKYNIPSEIHIYITGGHGYGLARNGGTESAWPAECENWLRALKYCR